MNRRQFCASAVSSLALATVGGRTLLAQTGDPGDPMTGDDPMRAAEYLSSLESNQYIPTLYTFYGYIHPDAAEVVPRGTVIGWYQEEFHPRGPQPAVAHDVTWLDSWTWGVTGKTYTDVAEVSFTQEFANGEVIEDVVRLQFYDGAWRWWFGRDATFVEEQIRRFSLIENTPQEGVAPSGLDGLTSIDESLLNHLPEIIDDPVFGKRYELAPSAGSFVTDGVQDPHEMLIYKPVDGSEYQLGWIYFGEVIDSASDEEDLIRFADVAQNAPPVEFMGWNAAPEHGPAWLQTEIPGVDVVGPSYTMTLVMGGKYLRIQLLSEVAIGMVLDVLGSAAS